MPKRGRTASSSSSRPSTSKASSPFTVPATRRRLEPQSAEVGTSSKPNRVTYSLSESASSSQSSISSAEIIDSSSSGVYSNSSSNSEGQLLNTVDFYSPPSSEETLTIHPFLDSPFHMSSTDIAAQLDRLQVDSELKESILAMDRETQIEMINDIVRTRNMERMENMLQMLGRNMMEDENTGPTADEAESSEEDTNQGVNVNVNQSMGMNHLLQAILNPMVISRGQDDSNPNQFQERVALFQQLRTQLFGMLQSSNEQEEALRRMGINRDIDEMSYEELLDLEEKIGNVSKGVPPEKLESVMVPLPSVTANDGQCMICLDQLMCETLDTGMMKVCRLTVCEHAFHDTCIKGWLKENKICPICKMEVCSS